MSVRVFGAGLVAALLVPLAAVADGSTAPVIVKVVALRSNAGQVGCMIFDSPKGYPTDPSAALQSRWCPIAGGAASCTFGPLPAGTYAVACFHDENGNGKMDRGLFGIPTEGTVASNHAKGFMGPPSFKDASFRFSGSAGEITLKMGY